ncbi:MULTISPECIES: FUSC family protein [unclassified Pseudonocardia]|uniref:FUSC family protein n=1 Tax=unclassified Pseudonocardia TaxID=2619320 RepID=UPI00095A718F|nr:MULTISPECIES: FUSC family protein [unclassified Pseudonocardia]OLM19891.1 Integral membrane protein [Pseudonocardia sp. Ae707_Ps1]
MRSRLPLSTAGSFPDDLRHRMRLAWRAGAATAAAWYLATLVPGVVGDYPYYAPMGALLVCYPTVVDSLRQSLRALTATAVGVGLGAAAVHAAGATWWGVALAVVLGMALGALPYLAPQRDTVPLAALFTILVGAVDPTGFMAGYLGQTLLGVAVGILVTVVLPPPPQNGRASRRVTRLRDGIADHLHEMAAVLAEQWPPEREEWIRHRHDFEPLIDATREAVVAADSGRRANLRARSYRIRGQQLYEAAQTLEQLAVLVRDISTVLAQTAWAERTVLVLDPDLRRPVADAMSGLATAVGSADLLHLARGPESPDGDTHTRNLAAARDSLDRVTERLDGAAAGWEDSLAASGIVLHLRRCLDHVQAGPSDRSPDLHPAAG